MSVKRKVSKILDTLADNDPQKEYKRPKTILDKLTTKKKKNTTTEKKQESTYAPWSRDQFLNRLSTFQYRNWSIPYDLEQISALECVKRGWTCLNVSDSAKQNTIQCVYCLAMMNINVGKDDERIQQKLADKYHEMLITQHFANCPWKNKGCDDTLYMLSLTMDQKEQFYQRYNDLTKEQDKIDDYSYTCTPQLTSTALKKLSIENINEKAATLALLGWKVDDKIGSNVLLLSCEMCFRKIVLNHDLDLVKEHMRYCPYVKKSQDGNLQWIHLYDLVKTTHVENSVFLKADARATNDDENETRKSRLATLKQIYFHHREKIR